MNLNSKVKPLPFLKKFTVDWKKIFQFIAFVATFEAKIREIQYNLLTMLSSVMKSGSDWIDRRAFCTIINIITITLLILSFIIFNTFIITTVASTLNMSLICARKMELIARCSFFPRSINVTLCVTCRS